MITYKEQFDKLTRAYINDEVQPFENCACFVGNLLNKHATWCLAKPVFNNIDEAQSLISSQSDGMYTVGEILEMEGHFMHLIREGMVDGKVGYILWNKIPSDRKEEILFKAFESTLEMLKAIHISKGEQIDESPVFVKRNLVIA